MLLTSSLQVSCLPSEILGLFLALFLGCAFFVGRPGALFFCCAAVCCTLLLCPGPFRPWFLPVYPCSFGVFASYAAFWPEWVFQRFKKASNDWIVDF